MKTSIILTAALAALAAGGLSLSDGLPRLSMTAEAQESAGDAGAEADTSASESGTTVEEMQIGDPDADVTVVEYASFTCPHCRTFHETVFEELKQNYIDTGKVNFVHREVYFDRYGLWAAMVARCGGGGRYFGIADLIYEQQEEWVQGEPAEIVSNLRRIGKTAGLDDGQLDTCLGDAEKAQALVETYQANAEADEITSTPSFVIDGTKYSNMSYDELSSILDEKLAE